MNVDYTPPPLADNDELLKQLKEATETKSVTASPEDFSPDDPLNLNPAPKINKADFTPELHSEPIPEPEPPAEPLPVIDYKEQARLLIAFVDGFQSLALPIAYQKSYFNEQETEQLKELKKRMELPGETVLTEQDQDLYSKYNDCQELIKDLPFTDREIKMLENPMSAVMEKYNFTPGPESLLIGAVFTVMAPRLAPLLITLR